MPNAISNNISLIIPEMRAQVAREIPEPAHFLNSADRDSFARRRQVRLFALARDIQDFLTNTCQDEDERAVTIALYREKSAARA